MCIQFVADPCSIADCFSSPDKIDKLYDPCRKAGRRIIKCIEQYQGASKTEIVKTKQIDMYDWTSVDGSLMAFARQASEEQSKYTNKAASGFWNYVRDGGRWFSEHAGNAKAFISLVPADSIYTSVLCGGLTFICKVRPKSFLSCFALFYI